jgi:hypothetical protein
MTELSLGQDLRQEMEDLIGQLQESLAAVILDTDERVALPPGAAAALANLDEALPETGCGAKKTIDRLLELNAAASGNTGGP